MIIIQTLQKILSTSNKITNIQKIKTPYQNPQKHPIKTSSLNHESIQKNTLINFPNYFSNLNNSIFHLFLNKYVFKFPRRASSVETKSEHRKNQSIYFQFFFWTIRNFQQFRQPIFSSRNGQSERIQQ